MEYVYTEKCDILRTWELLPSADGQDYSEEAIPERDPACRLNGGTWNEEATIEFVPMEARLDMARRLQQLGMSPTRAAIVASL